MLRKHKAASRVSAFIITPMPCHTRHKLQVVLITGVWEDRRLSLWGNSKITAFGRLAPFPRTGTGWCHSWEPSCLQTFGTYAV